MGGGGGDGRQPRLAGDDGHVLRPGDGGPRAEGAVREAGEGARVRQGSHRSFIPAPRSYVGKVHSPAGEDQRGQQQEHGEKKRPGTFQKNAPLRRKAGGLRPEAGLMGPLYYKKKKEAKNFKLTVDNGEHIC